MWKDGWVLSKSRFPDQWRERFFLGPDDTEVFCWSNLTVPSYEHPDLPTDLRNATDIGLSQQLGPLAAEFDRLLETDREKGLIAFDVRSSEEHSPISAVSETVVLLPQFIVCHWRVARKGHFGVQPAGGVVLHATNAADKMLMLTSLDLYDYSAKRALLPSSLHYQVFAQVSPVSRTLFLWHSRLHKRTIADPFLLPVAGLFSAIPLCGAHSSWVDVFLLDKHAMSNMSCLNLA